MTIPAVTSHTSTSVGLCCAEPKRGDCLIATRSPSATESSSAESPPPRALCRRLGSGGSISLTSSSRGSAAPPPLRAAVASRCACCTSAAAILSAWTDGGESELKRRSSERSVGKCRSTRIIGCRWSSPMPTPLSVTICTGLAVTDKARTTLSRNAICAGAAAAARCNAEGGSPTGASLSAMAARASSWASNRSSALPHRSSHGSPLRSGCS